MAQASHATLEAECSSRTMPPSSESVRRSARTRYRVRFSPSRHSATTFSRPAPRLRSLRTCWRATRSNGGRIPQLNHQRTLLPLPPRRTTEQESEVWNSNSESGPKCAHAAQVALFGSFVRPSMSRATSRIMSSCPPTIWRRPSSTSIERVSRPCSVAILSAWRKKLEYTPA